MNFLEMKRFEVGLILTLCFLYGITTTMASCVGGTTSSNQCYQPCGPDECKCNTTNEPTYDNCNQTCPPQYCYNSINYIICIAEKNCSQVCEPGACDMTCNAGQYCEQKADDNGAKTMSCSSKGCKQSCAGGHCEMMHCEADDCFQTCGQGGCTMNCTESVKTCSQSCTANRKCTMECRAEVCLQECSGHAQCIIVNASATSRVHLNLPLFVLAFFMLILH